MTPKEFFETVVELRRLQREVIRSAGRDRIATRQLKEVEYMIDREIKRVEIVQREQQQHKLNI